ncbi:MAG: hypothetical protein ISR48_07770 [Alphaproteobacteria bacterium]|nr:hypothetical protein [Alphaproteobacteria bacterium]
MPKTDRKKTESEDLAELSDEALDRTRESTACQTIGGSASSTHNCWGPKD